MTSNTLCEKYLKPEHLQAIGMVAAEFAYLENIISQALWEYAKVNPDTGYCITTHLTIPLRIDIIKSLFHEHFGECESYKELSKILEEIRKDVSPKRNAIVHSVWFGRHEHNDEEYDPKYVSVKARGKLNYDLISMDVEEIKEVADLIADYGNRLSYFLDTHALPPSS